MAVVAPTDRPMPVCNRCVIKFFVCVCAVSWLSFSDGIGVFVMIGLSQISSIFSFNQDRSAFILYLNHEVWHFNKISIYNAHLYFCMKYSFPFSVIDLLVQSSFTVNASCSESEYFTFTCGWHYPSDSSVICSNGQTDISGELSSRCGYLSPCTIDPSWFDEPCSSVYNIEYNYACPGLLW